MSRLTRAGLILLVFAAIVLAGGIAYGFRGDSDPGDSGGFGFRLTRPALAQTQPDFPVDDAGISAYVKLDPTDIDFGAIIGRRLFLWLWWRREESYSTSGYLD